MIGRAWCLIWAHSWRFMFTNGRGIAVLHCARCATTKAAS